MIDELCPQQTLEKGDHSVSSFKMHHFFNRANIIMAFSEGILFNGSCQWSNGATLCLKVDLQKYKEIKENFSAAFTHFCCLELLNYIFLTATLKKLPFHTCTLYNTIEKKHSKRTSKLYVLMIVSLTFMCTCSFSVEKQESLK